jgi:hypothetical protein
MLSTLTATSSGVSCIFARTLRGLDILKKEHIQRKTNQFKCITSLKHLHCTKNGKSLYMYHKFWAKFDGAGGVAMQL